MLVRRPSKISSTVISGEQKPLNTTGELFQASIKTKNSHNEEIITSLRGSLMAAVSRLLTVKTSGCVLTSFLAKMAARC